MKTTSREWVKAGDSDGSVLLFPIFISTVDGKVVVGQLQSGRFFAYGRNKMIELSATEVPGYSEIKLPEPFKTQ